jgi:hypothetical protein
MRKFLLSIAIGVGAATLAACGGEGSVGARVGSTARNVEADIAFVDANVIPMTDENIIERQTVLVRDGVIVAIGPSDELEFNESAIVVAVDGKYLIPGLADMHVHSSPAEVSLPIFVGYGVTQIRNMGGADADLLRWRADIEAGDRLGPRIVTAGPIVDGSPPALSFAVSVANADEAIAEMDAQQAAGFDFLKVYSLLSAEAFHAIAAHSREVDFPFAGHVPVTVTLGDAMRSGIKSIEHMTPPWVNITVREDGPAAEIMSMRDRAARQERYPEIAEPLRNGEWEVDDVFDSARRSELSVLAAEMDISIVPTLIVTDRGILTQRQEMEIRQTEPAMRFVNAQTLDRWSSDGPSDEIQEAQQVLFQEAYRQVAAMRDAGVRILAGSDSWSNWVVPGISLHQELGLLVEAGLTPYEALVAATRAPAEFLEDDSFGTIEVGRRGDLIMLEANPLEDISATQSIAGVAIQNRWLARDELDAMLDEIAGDE